MDMERYYGLLDRMIDVIEAENPVSTDSPAFFERTHAQMKRRAQRQRELYGG